MSKYEEPLVHQMLQIGKKYLSVFSEISQEIPIERFHYILLLIDEHKETFTQKALAELLKVDKSYIVTIIDYLTNNGFVYRETKIEDRRQQVIKLTQKAKDFIPKINESIAELNKKALCNLSKEKVAAFFEALKEIQTNLNKINTSEISLKFQKSRS